MATGGDWHLENKEIAELAASIATENMKSIAEGYLGIPSETVKNIVYENVGKAEAINGEIIRVWAHKYSGPNQVKVSCIQFFSI